MRLILTPNERARFWAKVNVGAPSDCWEWTAHRKAAGYGHFALGRQRGARRAQIAHRVSYALAHGGEIPDGRFICHTCDNPPCVNPAHLTAESPTWNARDMAAKGRGGDKRGETNANAKLNADDIRAIRTARANGDTLKAIGARFGIGAGAVCDIVRRRRWAHVR